MKEPLKPRDKITQKMSRDGLIEVNETKETAERMSRREQEADLSKQPEQAAQDAAAQLSPYRPTPPRCPMRRGFPISRTQVQPNSFLTAWTRRIPAKRQKRRRGKRRRKPPQKHSRPGCNLPTRNAPCRSLNGISKNPIKRLTAWTRQRRLFRRKSSL